VGVGQTKKKQYPVGSNKAAHQTQIDTRYQLMLSDLVYNSYWRLHSGMLYTYKLLSSDISSESFKYQLIKFEAEKLYFCFKLILIRYTVFGMLFITNSWHDSKVPVKSVSLSGTLALHGIYGRPVMLISYSCLYR
jgi:hypothetical protein